MSNATSRQSDPGTPRSSSEGMTNVKLVEPPSCSSASTIVFIGKNRRGNWVAQEQNGLYGGLFVNRAQAVKYALFENGHHPETIIELSREIELDMSAKIAGRNFSAGNFNTGNFDTGLGAAQSPPIPAP
jgi:hypothetical protein